MTHCCLSGHKKISTDFVVVAKVPVILNHFLFLNNPTLCRRDAGCPPSRLGLEIAESPFQSDFLEVK